MPPRGLGTMLVDVDGTIVSSNFAHAAAWSSALKMHGLDVEPEVVGPLGEFLPGILPTPGAKALVESLHDLGVKIVAASSASDDERDALLEIARQGIHGAASAQDRSQQTGSRRCRRSARKRESAA